MKENNEISRLYKEDSSRKNDCSLCRESLLKVGSNTGYGILIYKIGKQENGWFATLSPKTGGNPRLDFTIQLMPMMHLTHFAQIASNHESAKNFGLAFSKVCRAMASIMMKTEGLKSKTNEKKLSAPIATYGKCTTWKEKKEHLHVKVFPFRGSIGQPHTVDSSFEKKEVFSEKNGEKFVKMEPVKKVMIPKSRINKLAKELIASLK